MGSPWNSFGEAERWLNSTFTFKFKQSSFSGRKYNGCSVQKLWLPYEWFHAPEKAELYRITWRVIHVWKVNMSSVFQNTKGVRKSSKKTTNTVCTCHPCWEKYASSVGKGHALSKSRRCCIYACRMAESWNVVRVYRECESPVAEVRRNAAILLYQTDPRQSCAPTHERLLTLHRQKKRWWEKAGRCIGSRKAVAVCPTVVSGMWNKAFKAVWLRWQSSSPTSLWSRWEKPTTPVT